MSREIKKLVPSDYPSQTEKREGWKWSTLIHNGVLFAPDYEPLPERVRVLYKGKPVVLDKTNTKNPFNITAEEAAIFMAMKMEQDDRLSEKTKGRKKSVDDPEFVKNFWNDWQQILGKSHVIKSFKDVDFTPLQRYIVERSEQKKLAKKQLTKEEKSGDKEAKEAIKNLYGYAIIDGVTIPIGSYMVQPPGLYIGHGKHPLRGKIKRRIVPQDITLNMSKKYGAPKCFNNGSPCKWGNIVEEHDVTWMANYRNPITNEVVYVWLKREESHFVHADDVVKFDKARKLAENITRVRTQYKKDLTDSRATTRQLATAVYLLDVLAIRPGTEKDESKEAGTKGLTTLTVSAFKFGKNNQITINFTGKSSIDFSKTFDVDKTVYNNLSSLASGKKPSQEIFPDVNATTLNDYLKTLLPGLTAKVFRTYKASSILQQELKKNIPDKTDPLHIKKLAYDRANMASAIALNHKKMGGSDARIVKLEAKLQELKQKEEDATTEAKKKTARKSVEIYEAKLEEAQGNISLSTSKANYLDPRISVSWCKQIEMPIEKIYNKGSLKKFIWAMDTKSDWKY